MKNRGIPALILITALFFVLLIGYSLGNAHRSEIAVSVSPDLMTAPPAETTSATSAEVSPPPPKAVQPTQETFVVTFPVELNSALKEELMALPGIDEVLAQRILDYRAANGWFSDPSDLLKVPGIGAKRFAKIEEYVMVWH